MVSDAGIRDAIHEIDRPIGAVAGVSVEPGEPRKPTVGSDPADEAMTRYSNGDLAAFGVVYDAVCPEIMGWLHRRVRNTALVEDLVQQTFVKLHKHRGRFLPGARVRPWAMAIAMRLCIDHL